ncbi:hypothetical protein O6H91_11G057100 [Diphasiastrum complanatum]|uniref:Uncharacterized protein n=1 Tax=Diphasiastrum complanatum TaxID=34168 RepID=A0ACC2C9D7_DIPCM|nr:hypothetical protein O6H91_11G057100 [Diphasiastrum complanatum]
MSSSLDMSLDDIIKNNKQVGGGRGAGLRRGASNGGGYGSGRSSGPIRRANSRATARPSPYSTAKPAQRDTDGVWQHDLFEEGGNAPGKAVGIETGTKLYVSNLDYGVSNEDIKELFSEVGDLKRCSIHYDRSGRSKGTAEVVFTRKPDALAAMKRYNNVQLDGKPMKIELIGTNLMTGVAQIANGSTAAAGRARSGLTTVSTRGRGGLGPRRLSRGRGRGRGRRGPALQKSTEDLDADLENYHAEAMQTS